MLAQRDYKRMLAYSSIENMGLLALGAAIGSPLAIAAVLLHILGHGLAKSVAVPERRPDPHGAHHPDRARLRPAGPPARARGGVGAGIWSSWRSSRSRRSACSPELVILGAAVAGRTRLGRRGGR